MIRREMQLDGRDGWALISQVKHARLAYELARHCDERVLPLVAAREEFLSAVARHDDGWIAWETRPTTIDGRPRNFLEMPIDESLAIWRRSIAVAQTIGPLAAFAVSGHFSALGERAEHRRPHSESWCHLVDEFLDEQRELRNEWQSDYVARRPAGGNMAGGEPQLQRAVRLLQLFDAASLWFCCHEQPEPETFDVPDGRGSITLRMLGSGRVEVDRWPFVEREISLSIAASWIAAAHFEGPEPLAAAARTPVEIGWTLAPAGGR